MPKLQETLREKARREFDAYNGNDPNEFVWDGTAYPQALFFAQRLSDWVLRIRPDAGEPLILASRCQHIGRWEIPRDRYPDGRIGYLTWRKDLAHHHAQLASGILKRIGYDDATIARVETIVLKRGIKSDADVQTIENALCLVFLQFQYEAFRTQNPDKIVGILEKSLRKMDETGHRFALTLDYTPEGRRSLDQAIALL